MNKISAVIITRNEENMIVDCLASVSFCDEVIVVDNNSTDRTRLVSEKMGAKAFSLKTDDFSKLRNYGLDKAHGEWLLYVDADERISQELRREINLTIKNHKKIFAAYKLKRKNYYFGSSKENEWPYIETIERLFKKDKLRRWKGKLHESPIIDGKIGELNEFLLHYSHRDLTSMVNKTIDWSETEAKLRFDNNHPQMTWWRFLRVMLSSFFDSYIKQGGWRAGMVGIVESVYQVFSIFITYAKLWEMQQEKKDN